MKWIIKARTKRATIYAKACFGHPSPSKRQKNTWQLLPSAPRFVLRTCHYATSSFLSMQLRNTPSNDFTPCRNAFYFVSTYASASIPTKQRPYGYRGLKIFTSLTLRFQDFQRRLKNRSYSPRPDPLATNLKFDLKSIQSSFRQLTHLRSFQPA